MSKPLKYLGYTIAFQEVPNEVSLVLNISGCIHKCKGCHSDFLWDYEGRLVAVDLETLLEQYLGTITTVCFMGGDQNKEELSHLCEIVREFGLKCCVYSGEEVSAKSRTFYEYLGLDYYKLGEYKEECGGLASPTTNQRFYKKTAQGYEDITSSFWQGRV